MTVNTEQTGPVDLLTSALDQTAGILANVGEDQLDGPTPCDDWTVGRLIDHIVSGPDKFARMMRGEQPDFSVADPQVGADREERFRVSGAALLRLWGEQDGQGGGASDWQLAELAVHTWDLATATGQPTDELDPEVAQHGLNFMQQNLTDDNRTGAFHAARPAPADADPYAQIAAFAGRTV